MNFDDILEEDTYDDSFGECKYLTYNSLGLKYLLHQLSLRLLLKPVTHNDLIVTKLNSSSQNTALKEFSSTIYVQNVNFPHQHPSPPPG